MACTYPMIAYEVIGEKTKNGKAVIEFKKPDKPHKLIELPCGQCLMCRITQRQEWQKRIIAERQLYEHNYFLTLTYDDENLPPKKITKIEMDEKTGELIRAVTEIKPTLAPKDIVKFMKDLREKWRSTTGHTGIRFFVSGEYGEKLGRPHYHLILFNCYIPDLEYFYKNKQGQIVCTSKIINKIWGKGIVAIGSVTAESAGYVARYVLKKQNFNEKQKDVENEFINMSRNPGIGRPYYELHKNEIYKNDKILIPKEFGTSYFTKPPEYFDNLFFEDNESKYNEIKLSRRRTAQDIREIKESQTTKNWYEQKKLEERETARRMLALKRALE